MTTERLTPDLIEDTSEIRLTLRISEDHIEAHIIDPGPDRTELRHSMELPDKSVKALEDAIYNNPLLLGDFNEVRIIIDSHEFFLAPADAAELGEKISETMLPDGNGTLLSDLATDNIMVFYRTASDKYNFLQRTFSYAQFHHNLAVFSHGKDAHGIHAECTPDNEICLMRVDRNGNTTYLNHPQTYSAADCAYYILAVMQPDDDIYLKAIPEEREKIFDLIHQVSPDANILPPFIQ